MYIRFGGGPQKPGGRKADRALRSDPTLRVAMECLADPHHVLSLSCSIAMEETPFAAPPPPPASRPNSRSSGREGASADRARDAAAGGIRRRGSPGPRPAGRCDQECVDQDSRSPFFVHSGAWPRVSSCSPGPTARRAGPAALCRPGLLLGLNGLDLAAGMRAVFLDDVAAVLQALPERCVVFPL